VILYKLRFFFYQSMWIDLQYCGIMKAMNAINIA